MDILNKINELIKSFASNPYVTIIGFGVGLLSFVYAVYVARRDRKHKELSYRVVNLNVIRDSKSLFPKLDVSYEGKILENFTITKISITNLGSEVIRPEDIAKNEPLTISVDSSEGAELLEYEVLYTSDKNNQFSLQKLESNKVSIGFDFIEENDTVVFQILHTGKNAGEIKVNGAVIGTKKPFSSNNENIPVTPMANLLQSAIKSPRALVFIFSLILTVIFAGTTYLSFVSANYLLGILSAIPTAFFIFTGLVAIFKKRSHAKDVMLRDSIRSMLTKASVYEDEFMQGEPDN